MNDLSQKLDSITTLTTQGLQPVRKFAASVVDASEELARQNYAVAGDLMEFAVAQARLPLSVSDPKALIEAQVSEARAFADLMSERVAEYAELGKAFRQAAAALAAAEADAAKGAGKRAPRGKKAA